MGVHGGFAGHRLALVGIDATAGVSGEITELAIIRLDDGSVMGPPLTWWVRPAGPVTGWWPAHRPTLAFAPQWWEVADRVREELSGRVVVVHDAARYALLCRHLPGWRPPVVAFTCDLALEVWPDLAGTAGLELGRLSVRARCLPAPVDRTGAVVEAQTLALLLPALVAAGAHLPQA